MSGLFAILATHRLDSTKRCRSGLRAAPARFIHFIPQPGMRAAVKSGFIMRRMLSLGMATLGLVALAAAFRECRTIAPLRRQDRTGHRERKPLRTLVSGLAHQADDDLCRVPRGRDRRGHAAVAGPGVAQCRRRTAEQDGLPAWDDPDARQRAEDHHGEVGERRRHVDRREPRRVGGGLGRAHERRIAAARHDRLALGQCARAA